MNIVELSKQSSEAYRDRDWARLETVSKELFLLLCVKIDSNPKDIRSVAKNYLASIVAEGKFLLGEDPKGELHFADGLSSFKAILIQSPTKIVELIHPELFNISQIQLFLTRRQSDSLNKAASSLRRLARPDLAIELTSAEIAKSRLNYYSLVVRGSAYVDLLMIDEAIKDGEISLKYSLPVQRNYPLTLLARAYREKFKKNGDFKDGEYAIEMALEALEIKKDAYIARVFISIVKALGTSEYDDLIAELNSTLNFSFNSPDSLAIEIAQNVVEDQAHPEIYLEDDPWGDIDGNDETAITEDDHNDEGETISDYFADYFEEFSDSLRDPRSPHLEP
jgi:tetratricopeptide (TPR) repeat protein